MEGDAGLVWDDEGRIYHEDYMFFARTSPNPMPRHLTHPARPQPEKAFSALATTIQKYGHMYYHFVAETLPKLVLLRDAGLPAGAKVLTWGMPWEKQYTDRLGFADEQLVRYDPDALYSADTVYLPTPTPRITPTREGLLAVREALGIEVLPAAERDAIVYCSRAAEGTRAVANEAALLAALEAAYPDHEVVVYQSGPPLDEVIALFQRAAVIIGPHGAGLSHLLFAAPGTRVVEFLFMRDPPMMFWHMARALDMDYWMLPVPQAYWMEPEMEIPVAEVLDILSAALGGKANRACPEGREVAPAAEGGSACVECRPGTYSFGAEAVCEPCFKGRYAERAGQAACRTCPSGTFAVAGLGCAACPAGTVSWIPGAHDASQCVTEEEHQRFLNDIDLNLRKMEKLSPRQARRSLEEDGYLVDGMDDAEDGYLVEGMAGAKTDDYTAPLPDDIAALCREAAAIAAEGYGPRNSSISVRGVDCTGVVEGMDVWENYFIPDALCPTGMAEADTVDALRSAAGNQPRCVECGLETLVAIEADCDHAKPSAGCCYLAQKWNDGGCFCAAGSGRMSAEMGLSDKVMTGIGEACGFNPINRERFNCPAVDELVVIEDLDSAAPARASTYLAVAVAAAATLCVGGLLSD